MKKALQIAAVALFCLICLQCSAPVLTNANHPTPNARFTITYTTSPTSTSHSNLEYHPLLHADPTRQELNLSVAVHNRTHINQQIDLSNWEIETPQKLRTPALLATNYIDIPADSTLSFTLFFQPIHNLQIYKATHYRGQLQPQYTLHTPGYSFQFQFSDSAKLIAAQPTSIYSLVNSNKLGATQNEILHNGLVYNLKFFALNDSLHGNITLINHSTNELLLLPQHTYLRFNDSIHRPEHIRNNGSLIYNDTLFLPTSKRFWQQLSFPIAQAPDTFVLVSDGIVDHNLQHLMPELVLVRQ